MNMSLLVSTFLFIGKSKIFPGTIASLTTLVLWELLAFENFIFRLCFLSLLIIIAYFAINNSLKYFNEKDPQQIVIDEVVGMLIPLIFIYDNLLLSVIAFFLFRLFDILKPSIIYYSQYCIDSFGILFDDILSGVIVLLILINYL